jgi:hypothetical protein
VLFLAFLLEPFDLFMIAGQLGESKAERKTLNA